MWKREVNGLTLTFHLAGINNQNFLMRDDETGTFWQQISGMAVSGPLAGRHLELVHCDELSFAAWRTENPNGTVLKPEAQFSASYEKKDWEKSIGKLPSVVDTRDTGIAPRQIMLGIAAFGTSRAYPLERVLESKLVLDRLNGEPVLLVVGTDGVSVRAFHGRAGQEQAPDFYRKTEAAGAALFIDSRNGSNWDFRGCAIDGALQGRCLEPLDVIKDYWFDWRLYHPQTTVFKQ